jgi:hypothetical protein
MAGRDLRRRLSWKLATRVPPTLRPLLMHSPSRLPVRSCVQPPDSTHLPYPRLQPPGTPPNKKSRTRHLKKNLPESSGGAEPHAPASSAPAASTGFDAAQPAPSAGRAARPRRAPQRRTLATPPGRGAGPPPAVSETLGTLGRPCLGLFALPGR